MSIMDVQLMLRAAAAGSLEDADELTPASKDFGGPDQHPITYVVVCPALATGTGPTLDVVIQESDNDSDFRDAVVFPQIAAADTPGKFFMTAKLGARYRRYTATTGGTTPVFGLVLIAPVIGGQYEDF